WGAGRHETGTALLSHRGGAGHRAHVGPLLPQHGQAPGPRVRPQGRARRGDDPVPGGAPAVLAAAALAAPPGPPRGRLAALRGLHDVRDGVPGPLHLHRRHRAPESRDREDAGALRHRPREMRVLRLLRGGVPRGRHPHGHRHPRVLVVQPAGHDLHQGGTARAGARRQGRPPQLAGADLGHPDGVMELLSFVIIALLALGSALGLVLKRNAIHGALFLVVNLASVAALYLMLGAEFLAAAQVIVYAGAIMVLFVFAIMVLIPAKEV